MTAVVDARKVIKRALDASLQVAKSIDDEDHWLEIHEALNAAIELLEAVRATCLQCGGENARSGEYCSDSCRAAHFREHMPVGTVKSVRRLARDKASIVVHYTPDEANRAIAVLVGRPVYLAQEVKE